MTDRHIYTPTELNREVKLHLEAGFSRIWLEAEVSNLSRPASGHLYFNLKDDRAVISCAFFKSAAARAQVQPENGMKVLVSGRISLYEARGNYQLIVDSLQHAGEGLLQQKFEALKRKLQEEGLFDPERKRPIPDFPRRIALITSPSGAAVRDMLHVLERRWPLARVRIYPVPVQGEEAPPSIVAAINAASAHKWSDVVLLGRGGGSLEDLWAFNDEQVARAIVDCGIPLVSAVGHETDFSISDFVADLRAPTPSAAAELSTPDANSLKEQFSRLQRQLMVRMEDRKNAATQRLDHIWHRLQQVHPRRRLDDQRQRLSIAEAGMLREVRRRLRQDARTVTHLKKQLSVLHPGKSIVIARERLNTTSLMLKREIRTLLQHHRDQIARVSGTLNAVSPLETVGRGYALITSTGTHEVITGTSKVPADRRITAQVADGRLFCTVDEMDNRDPQQLLEAED
jgi:exodeoxyribonuclease VII large subunit